LENQKELEQTIHVQAGEKRLLVSKGEQRKVVPYDFSFPFEQTIHYMVFSEDTVYTVYLNGRLRTTKVKLYPGDILMVLEHGNYDYTPVRPGTLRSAWFKAYADWIAEKEIFNV